MCRTPRGSVVAPSEISGYGKIHPEHYIVFPDGRTEQHGPLAGDSEDQLREKSCAAIVDPLFAEAHGLDVAVAVENGKRVVVFQNPCTIV